MIQKAASHSPVVSLVSKGGLMKTSVMIYLLAMDTGVWAEALRRALVAELTKLREARGLSKNELSTRTGLARSFITTLKQGGAAPSVESLGRIAFALGISPGEILQRVRGHYSRQPEGGSYTIISRVT